MSKVRTGLSFRLRFRWKRRSERVSNSIAAPHRPATAAAAAKAIWRGSLQAAKKGQATKATSPAVVPSPPTRPRRDGAAIISSP